MSRSNLPKKGISRLKQKKGMPQLNKHIRISLSAKFSLNWQFRFFGQNFPKKRYLQYKTEKVNTTIEFCIFELVKSRYQIPAWPDNLEFLDQICPKRVFPVEHEKNKYQQWIQHIPIILVTKLQLKLTILIFGPNLPKKGICNLKQKN